MGKAKPYMSKNHELLRETKVPTVQPMPNELIKRLILTPDPRPYRELVDESTNRREAEKLYEWLANYLPFGIFSHLVKFILNQEIALGNIVGAKLKVRKMDCEIKMENVESYKG